MDMGRKDYYSKTKYFLMSSKRRELSLTPIKGRILLVPYVNEKNPCDWFVNARAVYQYGTSTSDSRKRNMTAPRRREEAKAEK
jgi:hypothetical protein